MRVILGYVIVLGVLSVLGAIIVVPELLKRFGSKKKGG